MNPSRFALRPVAAFCFGLGLAASPAWAAYTDPVQDETVSGETVDSGTQNVNGGGVANAITVGNGGTQSVNSGGIANATTVQSGGAQTVTTGGAADGAILDGGAQNVTGTATNTVINDGGTQTIYPTGIATGATVNSGGSQGVSTGGTANGTTLNGGSQTVNGIANDTTVNNGGIQTIYNNGTSNNLTVNNGGVLAVDPGATANLGGDSIIKDGGSLNAGATETVNLLDSSTLTIERGALTPNSTLGNQFTGAGRLIKTGAGALTLTGANTYSGGTDLQAGRIDVGNSSALGGGDLSMAGGTTLGFASNGLNVGNGIVLLGTGIVDTGANDATLSGIVSQSVVGAPGFLTKIGAGTLTLTGNNNYSGGTNLQEGRIDVGSNTALGFGDPLGASGVLSMAAGTTLGFTGNYNIFNAIALGGAGTVDTGGNDATLSGPISGAGGLTKIGSGTLTLTRGNTYIGGTNLNEGRIDIISDSGALGTGALTMNGGTTLGFATGGAPNQSLGNLVTLNGPATVVVDTGVNGTLSGVVSGAGALDKTGAGKLTLTGANTYGGGTTVGGGTLALAGAGKLGAATGALTVNTGGTLDLGGTSQTVGSLSGSGGSITNSNGAMSALNVNQAADTTYAGSIDGAVSLTKSGAGELKLTGANTYTGPTEVRSGILTLDGGGSLASDTMALYNGAVFINGGAGVSLSHLDVHGNADWDGPLNMAGKTMNFYVPATMGAGGHPMLSVLGGANISNATVNVGIEGASSPLKMGEQLALIQTTNGALTGAPANGSSKGEGMQGVTLKYAFNLTTAGNQLLATVSSVGANSQSKALSEGFLSSLPLVNETANRLAEQGIAGAVRAARKAEASPDNGSAFALLTGGSSRYDSGSHADLDSVSLIAGLSWGMNAAAGRVTLGAFIEYGDGSYDTYNSFADAASVHGKGDLRHTGGGVLGRFDLDNGAYVEGSVRGGALSNKFRSSDLGRYKTDSAYYGAHAGAGYVLPIDAASSVDVYGKYFWTRVEGDSATLTTGDPVKFKDADSSRLRLGARYRFAVNDTVTPYAGLAWEHEFDAKVKGAAYGYAIDRPSLDGDTGIGEVGVTVKPSRAMPLSVDVGVQGYTGKRDGWTGSLLLRYAF